MSYDKVVFERITPFNYLFLRYCLWRGKTVCLFYADPSPKSRVRRFIREGRITEMPSSSDNTDCYRKAIDSVEKVYRHSIGNSRMVRQLTGKVYKGKTLELAFKKELASNLALFYHVNLYLYQEEENLGPNHRILFIPHAYNQYLQLVKRSDVFRYSHQKTDIPLVFRLTAKGQSFFTKFKSWLIQIGMINLYLYRLILSMRSHHSPRKYEYAISVTTMYYQTKFKTKPVDFLLDGEKIRKDNTVFMLFNPAMPQQSTIEMLAQGLNVIDCSGRFMPSVGSIRYRLYMFWRIFRFSVNHMFLGLFQSAVVLKSNVLLVHTYTKWSDILQQVEIKHFIAFGDDVAISHVGRNTLLNQAGTKTWYYAHSGSFLYLNMPEDEFANTMHVYWSFLTYDYYVSWNEMLVKYFQLHPQQIGNYEIVGCLGSQPIVDVMEGRIDSEFRQDFFPEYDIDKYEILAFFDSSYRPDSICTLEDGASFYQGIMNLIGKFPNILIVVKEKKAEDTVLALYQRDGGNADVFHKLYKPAVDAVREHPRCCLTGHDGDPPEIIAGSDLTISMAFSSPTVEALGARKRAIFFDPGGRWRGCYYDKVPNLVAHSYEELESLVRRLLYETSGKEYKDYLDSYVKGIVDPYLDGKAVTRFRKLLSK